VASLSLNLHPDNLLTPVQVHEHDDLPAHVKGTAVWSPNRNQNGYFVPQHHSPNNSLDPVEFINNAWHGLTYVATQRTFCTRTSLILPRENIFGLGYWRITDPQHPEYQPPTRPTSRSSYRLELSPESSSDSGTSTVSAHSAVSVQSIHDPNSPAVEEPTLSIDAVAASFGPTAPSNLPPARPPTPPDVVMSVNATTATGTPPTNGLKGVAPVIFNGDRSKSDSFWNEFCRYRLLNRKNESISSPFYRVLTALSYIRGPIVEDWVNSQAELLEQCIDTTHIPHVAKSDEVLWTEFETAFQSAWKDMAKTQSAYDQLMKLQMKDLDVDTYNATFKWLASAAEWEPDAKGTIARYRAGLRENVHRRVVNRENLPNTMAQWKEAARKEVGRIKELQSAGLIGPRRNQSRDQHAYQTGNQRTSHPSSNNQHVPMDVDSTNITIPFRKLTDEERAKYCAEGRCFRCRTQGHMARNCPKNATSQNRTNSNARESTTSTPAPSVATTTTTPAISTPPPVPPKTSLAQQIRALEEKMTEEERGNYLDARDMGEDFCSAGY
jgi:hypothetical protein